MAETRVFVTVVGEDAPREESLPRAVHRLQTRACLNARVASAVKGVKLEPRCSYSAFAAEVNDDIDGGREAFEAQLRACAIEPSFLAVYLRLWDESARPLAIVHVAERVLP